MKFRKKPVVIDAVQFTGRNVAEIHQWTGSRSTTSMHNHSASAATSVEISTLEGVMTASPGDWIIRGVKGEFYPCKPDIFAATYEPADSPTTHSHVVDAGLPTQVGGEE